MRGRCRLGWSPLTPPAPGEEFDINGQRDPRARTNPVSRTSESLAAALGPASERIGNLVRNQLVDPTAFMPRREGLIYAPLVDLEIEQDPVGPRLRWLGRLATAWTPPEHRLVAATPARLGRRRVANPRAIFACRFDVLSGELRGISFWEPENTWQGRGPTFDWLLSRWLLVPADDPLFGDDERRAGLVSDARAIFEAARADALAPGVADAGSLH